MKTTTPKSSAFKSLVLLALGLLALAFAQPASAANIAWSAAAGTPSIPVDKIPGFFIWHTKTQVYLTSAGNTKKVGHIFSGAITVTGGTVSRIVGHKLEKNDYLTQQNSTTIIFRFTTYDGHDNMHFLLTGGSTISFTLYHDGSPAGNLVYYGSKKKTTTGQNPVVFNLKK